MGGLKEKRPGTIHWTYVAAYDLLMTFIVPLDAARLRYVRSERRYGHDKNLGLHSHIRPRPVKTYKQEPNTNTAGKRVTNSFYTPAPPLSSGTN